MRALWTTLACVAALPSWAATLEDGIDRRPRNYLGVLYGAVSADDARLPAAEGGRGPTILFGHQWFSGKGWEATWFSDKFDSEGPGARGISRYGLGIDAVYGFGNRRKFTPFVLAGGGFSRNEATIESGGGDDTKISETDFFAEVGAGFVTGADSPFNLRGEVRYVHDAFQDGLGEIRASLGVEIALRKRVPPPAREKPVEVIPPVEMRRPADADRDGVPDTVDQCAETPAGQRVDDSGCEALVN